jgi:PEP-CTERM motif
MRKLSLLSMSAALGLTAFGLCQPAYADPCNTDICIVSNASTAPAGFTPTIAQLPGVGAGNTVANPGFVDSYFDLVFGGYVAQGLNPNVSAPPYLDSFDYLAAEPGAPVTVIFAAPQTSFDIVWGSVDWYNTLTFYDAAGNVIGTFTGSDINASAGGNQGFGGTDYVDFADDSSDPIAWIVASIADGGSPAFEFDYSAPSSGGTNNNTAVPEPLTLSLFGAGLVGAAGLRRRRKTNKAA